MVKRNKSLAWQLIEDSLENPKVDFLDLGNCDLTDSSPELELLSKCIHLNSLSLGVDYYVDKGTVVNTANKGRENVFSTIPRMLPESLEYLQIRNAGIKRIDNTYKLENLALLDLSLNNIQKIENVNHLTHLTELALHGNFIAKIENCNELVDLQVLHLTRNLIERIENLRGLNNLVELYLSNNEIRVIEQLDHLRQLTHLDLNSNKIDKITGLSHLASLQMLNLSANKIRVLENLESLKMLEILLLANNQIRTIGTTIPDSIKSLDLRSNLITSIENLTRLSNVEELLLGGNKIKKIQPVLELKGIRSVVLNGNEIEDCPADIWQTNDLKQIQAYFETKHRSPLKKEHPVAESDTLSKDVKLILLGNSNTGKTNLVHYLKYGGFLNERNSTHGMEVIRWHPDKNRFPLLKNVVVNIWDFGGQEYYHEAYRLFLSANAVYVVLWDKDSNANQSKKVKITDTQEQEIEFFEKRYWLDTVRYYGENKDTAPLLLVQNKTDNQESDKERVSQEFFNQYKLTECHHISLKEGNDPGNTQQKRILENFERDLEAVLLSAADKAETSETWQMVRDEIIAWQEQPAGPPNVFNALSNDDISVSLDDFNSACQKLVKPHEVELSEHDLHTLPRWLDKTGAIVFFENNEELNKQVFINPKKLSEKIYSLLTKEVLEKNGEFSFDDVKVVAGQKEDANKLKLDVIEITKDLGLVFDHPIDKGRLIAPQYLRKDHAIEDLFKIASTNSWQDTFWIKVPLFYYKKLLHYLIIHYSADPDTTARYFWKHGIVFLKYGLRVLIKGELHEVSKGEGVIFIGVQDGDIKKELQKEIFQAIFEYEKNTNKKILPPVVQNTLTSTMVENAMDINEGKFVKNLQLSYDNESFETYGRLKELSNGQEQFFINETTKARLSLHRFAHILPFAVKTRMPKKIFVSYSHQNTKWLNKLRTHLSGLKRNGEVEDWTDQEIMAGEKWDKKIKESMQQSDVFICLLSADFVASDYIWNTELHSVFDSLKNKNKQIIFIYIEPFDILSINGTTADDELSSISIMDFEIIPKDENGHLKAVSLWQNENQALASVVKKIREAIR